MVDFDDGVFDIDFGSELCVADKIVCELFGHQGDVDIRRFAQLVFCCGAEQNGFFDFYPALYTFQNKPPCLFYRNFPCKHKIISSVWVKYSRQISSVMLASKSSA